MYLETQFIRCAFTPLKYELIIATTQIISEMDRMVRIEISKSCEDVGLEQLKLTFCSIGHPKHTTKQATINPPPLPSLGHSDDASICVHLTYNSFIST